MDKEVERTSGGPGIYMAAIDLVTNFDRVPFAPYPCVKAIRIVSALMGFLFPYEAENCVFKICEELCRNFYGIALNL
ncbi:hypothetical protein H671_2g5961 [Cricetulus griseus]|uniref:Uncharacterized protein n=1 Tax=Cricetulus griseus TaxID=10029 RepID=A0A061IEH4_CRIGR|nr:hypothetical protein H671_2g5961 [Cricetulus griseus]